MLITFELTDTSGERLTRREYDEELDHVISLFCDLSDFLNGRVNFSISALGEAVWPIDVWMELSLVLEQLPPLSSSIQSGIAGELFLYEQGVQCKLLFNPDGENYIISSWSFGDWIPRQKSEVIARRDFVAMLQTFTRNFLYAVEIKAPEMLQHPWFIEWIESIPLK